MNEYRSKEGLVERRARRRTIRRVLFRGMITLLVYVFTLAVIFLVMVALLLVAAPVAYDLLTMTVREEDRFTGLLVISGLLALIIFVPLWLLVQSFIVLPMDTWTFRKGKPRHRK